MAAQQSSLNAQGKLLTHAIPSSFTHQNLRNISMKKEINFDVFNDSSESQPSHLIYFDVRFRMSANIHADSLESALDKIHDNHPMPSVRKPGQAFTAFQENQYRLSALKDIEIAREKALKEIRSHRLELEKASKEWWDDKSDHDEKIAKCSKVFTTRLGEAIIADVRQLLKSHHYRSVWKFLESRSIAMENSGENQELLEDRLRELREATAAKSII
jgi:hypothetical protein